MSYNLHYLKVILYTRNTSSLVMVMPSHRRIACSICVSVDDVMMWAWRGCGPGSHGKPWGFSNENHGGYRLPVPYFFPKKNKKNVHWNLLVGQVVLVWNPSSGVDTFDQYPVLKDSKLQKRMEKVQTRWCSPGYVCWNTNHSDYRYIYHNGHLVYSEIGMGLVLDIPIYHNP